MNWILYITIGILLIGVAAGYVRGAVRIAVSLAATVFTLILVVFLTPYVSDGIATYTKLDDWIEEKCETAMTEQLTESWEEVAGDIPMPDGNTQQIQEQLQNIEIPRNVQTQIIENADIPAVFKEFLQDNNNKEAYSLMGADSFADYIAKGAAKLIINIISAVLIFLSTSLLIRILLYVFDVIAMLPIIGGLNRLAGAALGLMIALTVVWIFFLIVTLLYATDIGKDMLRMIQENPFLSFLYKNNYIWNVVTGLR